MNAAAGVPALPVWRGLDGRPVVIPVGVGRCYGLRGDRWGSVLASEVGQLDAPEIILTGSMLSRVMAFLDERVLELSGEMRDGWFL